MDSENQTQRPGKLALGMQAEDNCFQMGLDLTR